MNNSQLRPRDSYGRFISTGTTKPKIEVIKKVPVAVPLEIQLTDKVYELDINQSLEIPLQNNCIIYDKDYIETEIIRIVQNFSNIKNLSYKFEAYSCYFYSESIKNSYKDFYIKNNIRLYFYNYTERHFKEFRQPLSRKNFTIHNATVKLNVKRIKDYEVSNDYSLQHILYISDIFTFSLGPYTFSVSTVESVKRCAELFDSSMLDQINRTFQGFKDKDLIVIRLPFCERAGYPGNLSYDGHIQNCWFRPITLENYLYSVFIRKMVSDGFLSKSTHNIAFSSADSSQSIKKMNQLRASKKREFDEKVAELLKV